MAELYADVDGQTVPLSVCIWVFSHACGHAFGAVPASEASTERAAWRAFYKDARQRNAAKGHGVSVRLASSVNVREDDEIWRQLRDGCACVPGVNRRGA